MKRRRKFSLGGSAQKKSPSLSYPVLVSLWLGANVASEGLEEFSFFLEPAFALTQWLVLWLCLRNLGWWVIASTNGWLTASILIAVVGVGDWIAAIVPGGELDVVGVPLSIQAFWAGVLVRLLEWAVIGVFQWLVLRRHIEQASKWIVASALGGAVKGGVELVIGTAAGGLPGAMAGSLGYGMVTGVALVWLLKHRPEQRKSRVRATLSTIFSMAPGTSSQEARGVEQVKSHSSFVKTPRINKRSGMKRLRKFNSLTSGDRLLLISTFVWLGLVRLGLWLLPFGTWRRLIASVSRATHKPQEVGKTDQGKIVWAVNVASRYMPGGAQCLARALTAQVLMSRYGYSPQLRIGVAKGEGGQFEAHAWVECQGEVVIGYLGDLSRFTPMPSFQGGSFE